MCIRDRSGAAQVSLAGQASHRHLHPVRRNLGGEARGVRGCRSGRRSSGVPHRGAHGLSLIHIFADKTYFLSDSASVDYQRAIAAVAQGTSEITQVMAPVAPVADMSGLDVAADGTAVYVDQDPYAAGGQEPYYYADQMCIRDRYR